MAKRFTDTGIWQDEWFMSLIPEYKLAYMFIKDNCDQAGIWRPNKKLADIMIGCPVDWDGFLIEAGNRLKIISSGYWWLTKFCDFQYGKLSEKCKPHIKVIEILQKYNLLDRVYKGYTNPIQRVEDIYKEKEKEEEKEEDKKEEKKSAIIFPFTSEKFLSIWAVWKKYRKEDLKKPYKGEMSEQAALKKLSQDSGHNESTAIKIIENSIANQWQGLFELKENGKQNTDQSNKSVSIASSAILKARAMSGNFEPFGTGKDHQQPNV